ncbi:GON-4-like protein [Dissostichus eleginoides]|uniref:GON-4-like protein n=1 Tax=Dissostichus eleginoides TaxID=100907 RepID=A0AAD9B3N1_DISEL|nr:GON-4-like protein [Dissostichus eleginoides]
MNLVRKRLRLSPSRPAPPGHRAPRSHDALQHPAGGEEEEEEGYLVVETGSGGDRVRWRPGQVETGSGGDRVRWRPGQVETGSGGDRVRWRPGQVETGSSRDRVRWRPGQVETGSGGDRVKQLDQSLETKSKQHNLTTVNVRNIIHEVITNEHVVAMMKAAINDTEAVPAFEPKMTRAKFKEVVEKGVVIPAWNLSPIKKTSDANKAPQFVDIQLAEEDSSDEEYHPDEEEEDETAEDVRLTADWLLPCSH